MLMMDINPSLLNNLAVSLAICTKCSRSGAGLHKPEARSFPSNWFTGIPRSLRRVVSRLDRVDFPDFANPTAITNVF